MKVTEADLNKMDIFRLEKRNVNRHTRYIFYSLEDTDYGILFSDATVDWVILYDGIHYRVDLAFEMDNFSDRIKDIILFNIDLFR